MITGAGGQLGRALTLSAPSEAAVDAQTRAQLDLCNTAQLTAHVERTMPSIVINAAAYTAVERAETEPERAYAVNHEAVAALADCCRKVRAKLIHVSTDFVFDGQTTRAYGVEAEPRPLNVYGASKLAGERSIAAVPEIEATIVRTSWVYSPWGGNFVLTMLRLMRERGTVAVVSDQIGAPTSALTLAKFLWRAAAMKTDAVLHYSDAGVASWYDFAVAIGEESYARGLLSQPPVVNAIATADFPTRAKRPPFSLLDSRLAVQSLKFSQQHWRAALREVLTLLRTA